MKRFVRWAALSLAAAFLTVAPLALAPGAALAASPPDASSPAPVTPAGGTLTRAATPTTVATVPISPAVGAVNNCVKAGKVWLVVVTDVGTALSNRCVEAPASAEAALQEAGLDVERNANGTICRIGGFPSAPCDATTNRIWQHYQATVTTNWQYVQLSVDEAVPEPGTLQGWCFGSQCSPPAIIILTRGVNVLSRFSTPVTAGAVEAGDAGAGSGRGWLVGVGAVIVVAVVVVIVVVKRRPTLERSRGKAEA